METNEKGQDTESMYTDQESGVKEPDVLEEQADAEEKDIDKMQNCS